MEQSQHSHEEIDYGGYEQTCGHEAADIAVICDESVDELADSIDEEQGRTDKAKLSGGENTLVDKRLLDYAQTQTAHIIKTIGNRDAPECLSLQGFIDICLLILRNSRGRRLAYPVKRIKSHTPIQNSANIAKNQISVMDLTYSEGSMPYISLKCLEKALGENPTE